MLLVHPSHPDRGVRLAYCLNLHAADDLAGTLAGIRDITVPLSERLGAADLADGFGVGLYLPAHVALELTTEPGGRGLAELTELLAAHDLDPFTCNAFPYGGFHREGLKEAVFRPTWKAPERTAFTLAVAEIGLRTQRPRSGGSERHLSVSTHTGAFGAWVESEDDRNEIADNFALTCMHLAGLEERTSERVVLSLEPEPRSLAGDTRALPALFERIHHRARGIAGAAAEQLVSRYLGTCLDACHTAVEFEQPAEALANATHAGTPLGKLQFSSALTLADPGQRSAGRERLFALAEPVYLHQVTGRRGAELLRSGDLPEVAAAVGHGGTPDEAGAAWLACDEWRCHFHVPVDLGSLDSEQAAGADAGLGTTRAHADRLLATLLAAPERWGTRELHVEIETYTWDVLPGVARGSGDLIDGLEREYAHVLAQLARAGWEPARHEREGA